LGLRDGHTPVKGKLFHDVVARIIDDGRTCRAGTICTTWLHDPHQDHYAAFHIGREVAREIGAKLLCYPVWGWTIPANAWLPAIPVSGSRLDIANHLKIKQQAIACHLSQIADLIHDDPRGFRLSPEVLSIFDWPFEVFSEA
jgi:LmbE family N-acetylglucosaminyl deacetylase